MILLSQRRVEFFEHIRRRVVKDEPVFHRRGAGFALLFAVDVDARLPIGRLAVTDLVEDRFNVCAHELFVAEQVHSYGREEAGNAGAAARALGQRVIAPAAKRQAGAEQLDEQAEAVALVSTGLFVDCIPLNGQ